MAGEMYINGNPVGNASAFIPEEFDIDRGERASDGTLNFDVIATKHKFTLKFELLTGAELATLKAAAGTKNFVTFQYTEGGVPVSYTVWCYPIQREIEYADPETWQNVVLTMEER